MDRINITGLEVFAHHGVYQEENVLGRNSKMGRDIDCLIRANGTVFFAKVSICRVADQTADFVIQK